MLMQNVQMTRMTVRDQPFRASVSDVLTRTDAQIVMASFSNESYAADAKELSTLCDKKLKQSPGGVLNESVKAEMQRRPGMYGRLVIPSVGVQLTEDSYLPLALNEVQVYVPAKNFGAASSVTYRLGGSVAEAGEYRLALVKGKASDSVATFQNGEETVLSGARSVADGIYLTITAPLNEGQQSEQTEAIKQLLSDVTVSSIIPPITLFGETLSKDVAFETDGNYMQLQKGEDTVLVSEFKQTIDTSILEKTATLPNGLTLKYGNISDSKTGYVPFITTVGEHKYKFLATSADVLQEMFIA